MVNNRPMSGRGLYSLRGGQVQPVLGPAPGVNAPQSPMMMPPAQRKSSSVNIGQLLSSIMSIYAGTAGQQGAAGQQQGSGIFGMLKGLFGRKSTTGTVPAGSIRPGVNYSTLGRTYGM